MRSEREIRLINKSNRFQSVTSILGVFGILFSSTGAMASGAVPVVLTPKTIQDRILNHNYDVRQGMIDVLVARDQTLKSKLALLPSLAGTLGFSGSPLFNLNTVACLVPFLIPGKWYDVRSATQREMAALHGLYTSQLNIYAIAYTLIRTHIAETESYAVLADRVKRMRSLRDRLQRRVDLGVAHPQSLVAFDQEFNRIQIEAMRAEGELARQRAHLRFLSGLELKESHDSTDFTVALNESDIRPSRLEGLKVKDVTKKVFYRAPERTQLLYLASAARAQKNSTYWSFITGCGGANVQQSYNSNGQLQTTAPALGAANGLSINLSATLYADLSLNQREIDRHELSLEKAQAQMAYVLEETLVRVRNAKRVEQMAREQLSKVSQSYQNQVRLVDLGLASPDVALEANNNLTLAELDLIRAKSELDGHRITLKRMNLEEEFMDIYVQSRRTNELKDLPEPQRQ